jgi:tRNA-binding protein
LQVRQRSGSLVESLRMATFDDFQNIDVRVGEIVAVEDFPRARSPSYKIKVNFGAEIGEKWSAAQATNYTRDELLGKRVVAVVNFDPKNIAGFMSECLILGVPGEDGQVSLLTPSRSAPVGGRMY